MHVTGLKFKNFRNLSAGEIVPDKKINVIFGDNAQGKTNILEAIYLAATTKSHKGSKDKEIIAFGKEEGHIRTIIERDGAEYRVDMHLRKSKSKAIAIDSQKIRKASDLVGRCNVVFFSPEDLSIIKDGPAQRRRFMDMELCQLDQIYLENLAKYNKLITERNKVLKDMFDHPDNSVLLDVQDKQLLEYGSVIIKSRDRFIKDLCEIIDPIHNKLTGGREKLKIYYEPNVTVEEYEKSLRNSRQKDIYLKQTTIGPHKDDFSFNVTTETALSEIEIVKKSKKENPVLLLDDVLSELDSNRQNYLLNTIGNIQTIITCTGLDEFVNNRFEIDKVFRVVNGSIPEE